MSDCEIKNIDCLSPEFFYSTFIPARDEGESEEEDATSAGTAKGDTVTVTYKLYKLGELLLV